MAVVRARFIPQLLQVHLEDLAFIAGQRRDALTSRRHTLREFGELSERLEAHVQGVLVAPAPVLIEHLRPQLAAADRDEVFAAAYALLRSADPAATHSVIVEFSRAGGAALAGLRDALSLAPSTLTAEEMQSAHRHAKPATAVAAAAVLANHRLLDPRSPRLDELLQDADPAVSALAWAAAQLADVGASGDAPARPFSAGVSHPSAAVRTAAWSAVAWAGETQAWPALRKNAESGDAVALHWLAVLGSDDDAPALQSAVLALDDPRLRCELLARFGHPPALNALVRWMEPPEPVLASAAGEAFTRITGHDVRGVRRPLPVPEGADDFDREMAPEVWLPDVDKARALLERHAERWAAGSRWCAGHRVDGEVARELLTQLDLDARWDVAARAAMAGRPVSAPRPIH